MTPIEKTWIFDWNGTLLNDVDLCYEIVCNLASKYGVPSFTKEDYLNSFGFPIKTYYEPLGFDFSKYEYENLTSEFMQQYHFDETKLQLYPATRSTISKIKQMGIDMEILSAYQHSRLNLLLKKFELTNFFREINGIENDMAHSKSHLLEARLETLVATDCLMIGDTLHDAEIAYNHGINCVLIAQGYQSKERLLNNKYGFVVIDNLDELFNEESTFEQ
jgi:phosphoglycolate phosphatase